MSASEDKESKVQRGAKLRIKASTFNDMQDVVRAYKRNKFQSGPFKPTLSVSSYLDLFIKNQVTVAASGGESESGDIEQVPVDLVNPFRIVRILQPVLPINDPLNVDPAFEGIAPTDFFSPFAVTQEPIKYGELGKAIFQGLTVAIVGISSRKHQWANPVAGETEYLRSAECGQARILMDLGDSGDSVGSEEDSGESGESGDSLSYHWCLINLIGSICIEEDESGSGSGSGDDDESGSGSGSGDEESGSGDDPNSGPTSGLDNCVTFEAMTGGTFNTETCEFTAIMTTFTLCLDDNGNLVISS